jgi:hypothetical protein
MSKINRSHVTQLSGVVALLHLHPLSQLVTLTTDFSQLDDEKFHHLKNKFIEAKSAILSYLNNPSNLNTPINPYREAQYGFTGINTVRGIALACEDLGMDYALLHKSHFLGVDDINAHTWIKAFSFAYYALMDYVGFECRRTDKPPFVALGKTYTPAMLEREYSLTFSAQLGFKNTYRLTLSHIGEGDGADGLYDATNANDTPYFRFDFEQHQDGVWEALQDASYCTALACDLSEAQVTLALDYLKDEFCRGMLEYKHHKRTCERLSNVHVSAEDPTVITTAFRT